MVAVVRFLRLARSPTAPGLRCEPDGLALAGVPLLRKSARNGFALRPEHELAALMLAAYGEVGDIARLTRGLSGAAEALNRGDVALAMTSALHLRLPDLGKEPASRLTAVDDFLAKYDPDEPVGTGAAAGRPAAQGLAGRTPAPGPGRDRARLRLARPSQTRAQVPKRRRSATGTGSAIRPAATSISPRRRGKRRLREKRTSGTATGGAGAEPSLRVPRLPPGFDISQAGLSLPDGRFWPEATTEKVILILRAQKGGSGKPKMWLFAPVSGKGPVFRSVPRRKRITCCRQATRSRTHRYPSTDQAQRRTNQSRR